MKEKLGSDSIDFRFFKEFWTFYEMFNVVEPTNDNYWRQLIDVAGKLANKYKGTEIEQMVKDILMARLKHLERKGRT